MFDRSMSLIPKMVPTANTPAAMLKTANNVRVLLCQRSNQILYQMTPILDLLFPEFDIFLLVSICCLVQRLPRDLRLLQQFVELIVTNRQHFHSVAVRGADRSIALCLV